MPVRNANLSHGDGAIVARWTGRMRILLVDDDRDWTTALAEFLELFGFRVAVANEGGEALAAMRDGPPPAAVVLDLSMGGMDGVRFRSEQLADPSLAAVPILLCSAALDAEQAARSLQVDEFLSKPVGPMELLRTLRRLTRGAGGRRDDS
jgi:CheY-like chemotaxis protein